MSGATCEPQGLHSLHFPFADLGRADLRSPTIGKTSDHVPERNVGGPTQ